MKRLRTMMWVVAFAVWAIAGCARAGEIYNPMQDKSYTDLQQALDEVQEGEAVQLGPGEFVLDQALSLYNKQWVTISGAGRDKTKILVTSQYDVAIVVDTSSYVTIENLYLGHSLPPEESCLNGVISAFGVNGLTIRNNEIVGSGYRGIELYDGMSGTIKITGNLIHGNQQDGIAFFEGMQDIYELVIMGNEIRDNGGYGVICMDTYSEAQCAFSEGLEMTAINNVIKNNAAGSFGNLRADIKDMLAQSMVDDIAVAAISNADTGQTYGDIQTAINQAGPGEVIQIGPGEIYLSGAVSISGKEGGIVVRGAGSDQTAILVANKYDVVFLVENSADVIIEQLYLGHAVPREEGCVNGVISVFSVANLYIWNNELIGSGYRGIEMGYNITGTIDISNNLIHQNQQEGIAFFEGMEGVTNLVLTNNTISDNGGYGIACIAYEGDCGFSQGISVDAAGNVLNSNAAGALDNLGGIQQAIQASLQ